jgi:hypothetical protein
VHRSKSSLPGFRCFDEAQAAQRPARSGGTIGTLFGHFNLTGGRTLQIMPIPDWPRIVTHRPLRAVDIALARTNTAWRTYLEHDTFDGFHNMIPGIG